MDVNPFFPEVAATRDLLLPEASALIANLGIQLSFIGLNSVPRFSLSEDDVLSFIKATCGSVISVS